MQAQHFRITRLILLFLFIIACIPAMATHIIGGEITYQFIDSVAAGNRYKVNLVIYEDCQNGTPVAIAADDPAFIAAYDGNSNRVVFDSVHFASADTIPANINIECVKNPPLICMIKKSFIFNITLPANASGYTLAYQRCCHNGALVNIITPIDVGSTFFCTFPPATVVRNNNSAVFINFPPQIICVNYPLFYNNAAYDADGDSLSYELCTSYSSDNTINNDDPPPPPPYQPTRYVHPPYSFYNPMTGSPALAIDPVTGIITGKPLWIGRYLVTVCCNEWRGGIMINTIHREFQFVVTDCSKSVVADIPTLSSDTLSSDGLATFELNCSNYTIHFINTSIGGTSWHWDFGVAGVNSDTSNDFQPVFTYPDSGTYTVKLIANPGTPCTDSIVKLVKIYPPFNAAFTDTGKLCPGAPIGFIDQSIGTINQVINWSWNFGDGGSSLLQNNVHTFQNSGTYNVVLVSENTKNCIDTAVHQVVIEDFIPFAGNDTTIVKGQSIQFNAAGGISYQWSPPENLNYTNISNPIGYYPETGKYQYILDVTSTYGCKAQDTINILVVDQAEFYVPTGFSPNGDGKNDFFKPIAVGYRALKYFIVYDRWGAEVFKCQDFSEGWDGSYNGHKAELGTYYWELAYIDLAGKEGTMKGDVTLLR